MTDKTPIVVTIAVKIGDQVELFEAEAATASDAYEVADGLLSGLRTDAGRWLGDTGRAARRRF